MLPSVYHSFYGDFDYLEQVLFTRIVTPGEVAAIVVESWLGEGGYVLPPEGWFRYLRELCDRHGILLVCDEVQSGMGRSGTMWAIEQEGVDARHHHRRQGHRERAAAGRDDRPRRRDDVGSGRARIDLRRLARAVRGGPRDARRDRAGGSDGQRLGGRRGLPRGHARDRGPAPDRHRGARASAVDRALVRRPRAGGGGRARVVPPGAARPRMRRRRDPHLARRSCSARTRRAPRSRSSKKPSPRSRPPR